ncbi:hypothetical protein RUND412_004679 [Rhizina undulata]
MEGRWTRTYPEVYDAPEAVVLADENAYKPHVAFFGPTGGCALAALIRCLRNGYTTVALSRSSEKLIKILDQRGLPPHLYIEQRLRIVEGDVNDPYAIKQVFEHVQKPVGVIVLGVGSELPHTAPLVWMRKMMKNIDKTLCQDAVRTILSCIPYDIPPPLFIALSSTGIDTAKRDIPLLYLPFYKTMLACACKDKAGMEAEVLAARETGVISDWIFVRPALMLDTKGARREKAGKVVEVEVGEGVMGYMVTRQVVGDLVYECIRDGAAGKWVGRKPCVAVEYQ